MSSASTTTTTQSFVERVQDFVSENKRAIIVGTAAAAIAVGGVVYYASSSRANSDLEKAERRPKDKKKPKKRKSAKDNQPILEEIVPSKVEEEDVVLTAEQIAAMPDKERAEAAASLKTKGNNLYKQRKFAEAVELYTRAIQVASKADPVFYSNRAACYVNMSPPKHELVVHDCDEALKLDSNYVKALNRRAIALEGLERYEESLRDFTAATILDKFQNETAAQSVERVLKKISTHKANEIISSREPRLPSFTFISAYFAAFRPRSLPTLPENPTTGDNTLILALQALEAGDYSHSVVLVNEAVDQGISWGAGEAEALNLRGTFKFLMGDVLGAKADLLQSISLLPSFTQSLVKVASVHMEQGDREKAFECFEEAIRQDPNDADVYYHRGQVLFITNEFEKAAENYQQSMNLDDTFVFSHIQLAVAQYKMGNVANSMATFRRTLTAFPQRSEPPNYYGELLLDQQRFQDAVEKFERAIEIERAKAPPMNVLSLVNKGLALYQWKQDIGAAERCCNEALRIDPECEAAVATIAQLSLQQSNIERAIEMFDRQAELARSEPELINALTYRYASAAQMDFMKNYPDMANQLNQMARTMQM
ncbi:hypothetical protein SERLA73DRAFT_92775 [Serpula lacrymans var. lacrymans S7.3]|uniref:ADP/ATP carrier receptor n=2 Tax=Serpula lacrymans var. lacrymans TaxID=341189 RepID=F8Q341_SERL3|nr:uncharacterized protein SERLADRAFT_472030 [Serpula lacrymans var. lacrymans S7.9]EGN97602.1 hypothetical protein SERLA73DRAFT_92775 [Serpula lacrymans var. lacrymans S7.3]EGO23194.1 hypothetical protein SERLADRAFT_472030 [Serpula lacrymans var. lacrymans S7.9]